MTECLESIDRPVVRLSLPQSDCDDGELGNQLADAVNSATRSKVFQYGLGLSGTFGALDKFVELLGPFTIIVVGGEHLSVAVLEQVFGLNRSGTQVVVFSMDSSLSFQTDCAAIDSELCLTFEEALWLTDGVLAPAAVEDLIERTNGSYTQFVHATAHVFGGKIASGLKQESSTFDAAQEFGLDVRTVLAAVLKRKKYVEAFRLAVEKLPEAVPGIVEDCGEAYFERGLFERFWILLQRLPESSLGDEAVLRWYYATAMALNRHADVVPLVEKLLAHSEAPELRAHYAASMPRSNLLSETTRAVLARVTPITLRHHAFALSISGQLTEAIETLQRALRLAELLGRDQLVVAIATDIATALQRNGAFRESLWWGEWASSQYIERGLNEHYRRLCALSAMAFSKLLTGQDVGLAEALQELHISESLLGVPSYEGIVSTVADASFVRGQLERALQLYEAVYDSNPFDQVASASVDYVKCLVEVGRLETAIEVGGRVVALSRGASEYERNCALLSLGIARRAEGHPDAVNLLRTASNAFSGEGDAIRFIQAKLNLILLSLHKSAYTEAVDELDDCRHLVAELGGSGWTLLGGHSEALSSFRSSLEEPFDGIDARVLGSPSMRLNARSVELSDRQLDFLVVLLSSQDGLTLQEVATRVYGDRAVLGTAKALISRLRGAIPVESRPYRLAVPYRADFLELLEHLKRGQVRQALNLYKGPLLPDSDSPAVVELREHIDEALRQAVLESGDAEAMIELANRMGSGDLELLETALEYVPQNDPQSPLLRARIRQVRRDWGVDGGERDDRGKRSRTDRRSGER